MRAKVRFFFEMRKYFCVLGTFFYVKKFAYLEKKQYLCARFCDFKAK